MALFDVSGALQSGVLDGSPAERARAVDAVVAEASAAFSLRNAPLDRVLRTVNSREDVKLAA